MYMTHLANKPIYTLLHISTILPRLQIVGTGAWVTSPAINTTGYADLYAMQKYCVENL